MPESEQNIPESIRSKEQIAADLEGAARDFEKLDKEKMDPIREEVGKLSEEQRTVIDGLVNRFGEEGATDDEVQQTVSADLLPLALRIRDVLGEAQQMEKRRLALEEELTPYRKEEFEGLVEELAKKVDYSAVFDYYRSRESGRSGSSDLLINTRDELFFLRDCQHEREKEDGGEERDFQFYDFRCATLERFRDSWEEKGFLAVGELEGAETSDEYGEMVASMRRELVEDLEETLEELDKFNRLASVYRHTLTFSSHFDLQLSEVCRCLDIENGPKGYGYENFEAVDFDPRFVRAAQLHTEKVIEEHRKLGNLPPTAEILEGERKRIDSIVISERLSDVEYEGFNAPEGMVAVVTPQEIAAEMEKLLPPDLLLGIKTITRKERPAESPEDSDQAAGKTVGEFFPIFDDNRQFRTAKIEIYRDLVVPSSTGGGERDLVRRAFMKTFWHEVGHYAHHSMRYEEMENWEQVTATDKTAATWYVKAARASGEGRGRREDFADSFKLFLMDPALLDVLSPSRYQFMKDYFERRLQTTQLQGFGENLANKSLVSSAVWEKNGYSREDIRKIYLSFEFET